MLWILDSRNSKHWIRKKFDENARKVTCFLVNYKNICEKIIKSKTFLEIKLQVLLLHDLYHD